MSSTQEEHPHIQKPRQTTNFGSMSSASSFPKTETKYQLGKMISASSYLNFRHKVPTLAGCALHPHIQKHRRNSASSYPKTQTNTNFGRMNSASSYPKTQIKYQIWKPELCMIISKIRDKVSTLAGCTLKVPTLAG